MKTAQPMSKRPPPAAHTRTPATTAPPKHAARKGPGAPTAEKVSPEHSSKRTTATPPTQKAPFVKRTQTQART
eukprot:24167-Pyramimonas_sp.AAC.1